jgi:phosphoribosyl 1,2-cyclic phosphodiesterase
MIDVINVHKITSLDAVVITHGHSDAFLGLDDLREFTEKDTVPVFIRKSDVPIISNCFPYLFDTRKATGSGYVSKINFVEFDENEPFDVLGKVKEVSSVNLSLGLKFTPLIVEHGPRNTALGFRIQDILYLSDLSGIPETTRPLLEGGSEGIQLLIIDSLRIKEKVNSHFNLEEALVEIRRIKFVFI